MEAEGEPKVCLVTPIRPASLSFVLRRRLSNGAYNERKSFNRLPDLVPSGLCGTCGLQGTGVYSEGKPLTFCSSFEYLIELQVCVYEQPLDDQ